ncbi:hypothetical protein Tco_0382496 [Tanacetum coccineum]
MTTLKFVDTYNMVAFLSKSAKSEGFKQIVDLINAHSIKHALTVNLTIYTSCIEQFWATVKAKTINGEVQLQALVDGKKIIITESTVRRDLQLEDADGVDCLPNATIFEQLTLMGYEKISQKLTFYKAFFSPQWKFLIHTVLQCLSSKTTAWNEFSSTMASAIICLATNQKFNFSKYIFESMVKNLDNVGKFLMYPRFVQVFLDKQVDGMASHKRIYIAPSHTKKIFGNMRRVGKGFSGRETPLFQTMVVQDQAEMGEGSAIHTDPHHTPTFIQPSTSQPQMKQRSRRPKRKDTQAASTVTSLDAEQDRGNINKTRSKATLNEPSSPGTSSSNGPRCQETMGDTIAQTRFENVSKHSNDPLLARGNLIRSGKDRLKLKKLMELCTNLQTRVLDLDTTKTTQANEIASLKRRVKKLERRNKSRTYRLKRLYRVGLSRRVKSSEDEDMFGVNDLDGDEVIVESVDVVNTAEETRSVVEEVTAVTIPVSDAITTTTTTAITNVEMTLAQAMAELKSAKPKADKVVIQEPEQGTTTPTLTTTTSATTITAVSTRPRANGDKGKGKMVKPKPVKKMSKKDLLKLDEELAFKLQAEEEEERLPREKAQLQAQEKEELTNEEKARLFCLVIRFRYGVFGKLNMAVLDELAWAPRIKYSKILAHEFGYTISDFWIRRIDQYAISVFLGYGVLGFLDTEYWLKMSYNGNLGYCIACCVVDYGSQIKGMFVVVVVVVGLLLLMFFVFVVVIVVVVVVVAVVVVVGVVAAVVVVTAPAPTIATPASVDDDDDDDDDDDAVVVAGGGVCVVAGVAVVVVAVVADVAVVVDVVVAVAVVVVAAVVVAAAVATAIGAVADVAAASVFVAATVVVVVYVVLNMF